MTGQQQDRENFVIERRAQRDDIQSGAYDKIRAEAPNKEDAKELFDHANKKYNAEGEE